VLNDEDLIKIKYLFKDSASTRTSTLLNPRNKFPNESNHIRPDEQLSQDQSRLSSFIYSSTQTTL
jgi:hypothetical protein